MDFNVGLCHNKVGLCHDIVACLCVFKLCRGLVTTLPYLCSFWLLMLHCCDKIVKCRDIHVAFMFSFFVVSLSHQY